MERGFTIGELARRSGVPIETIRYYERIGLMPGTARTESGRRIFGQDQLSTLNFIRRARGMGFSLKDIGALLPMREEPCCSHVKAIASRHLENVRAKLVDLLELERVLADAVARCPGDPSPDCSVLELLEAPTREDHQTT
jgi:MerR family mercuric resistance operon transcriptional regulator